MDPKMCYALQRELLMQIMNKQLFMTSMNGKYIAQKEHHMLFNKRSP